MGVLGKRQLKQEFGQPEPCDGEEEGVVGDLGAQVGVEAAGHTGLALANLENVALVRNSQEQLIKYFQLELVVPGKCCFGEEQPRTTDGN